MDARAAIQPEGEAISRAPEEVVRAVDAALEQARSLARRADLPLEGDLDSLALLSGCDVDDELDNESCDTLATVLDWLGDVGRVSERR